MEIPSMDGETSSMDESVILDVIHGWRNVIGGCHPWMEKPHLWMTYTNADDGQGRSLCQ